MDTVSSRPEELLSGAGWFRRGLLFLGLAEIASLARAFGAPSPN